MTAERIKEILERWYMREPLLLMTCLSHELTPSLQVNIMRCGEGKIEYNPQYCDSLSDEHLEEILKAEVIRILLLHPYRMPASANRINSYRASNITLNEYYQFGNLMHRATDYWEDTYKYRKQSVEFYYAELQKLPPQAGDDDNTESNDDGNTEGDNNDTERNIDGGNTDSDNDDTDGNTEGGNDDTEGDNEGNTEGDNDAGEPSANPSENAENATELWGEDDYIEQQIKEIIEWATSGNTWGTLSDELQQTLIASLKPEINYRKVLNGFRASVLSSKQMLTRFRPSRRYGFEYMGKKPKFTTKLLIGVDVSGSISNNELQLFYSTINRFFKYGIENIEVQQFDCELKGEVMPMKKARKEIKVVGRGGTCFQPVIDLFSANLKQYDGLIIFTDGYAEIPSVKPMIARKMLWICDSKESFEYNKEWMTKTGRVCWIKS